jgi:hypothetical protein
VRQYEGFETNGKVSVEFRERHLQPLGYPVVVLVWLRSVLVDNRKAYNIGNHYSVNLSLVVYHFETKLILLRLVRNIFNRSS